MSSDSKRSTSIEIPTPCYVVYEERLRRNLNIITDVAKRSGAEIIMAFKANALWRTFDIFREYGIKCTASSLNEMKLGNEELCCRVHSYCPAYTTETIYEYLEGSSHITFNSLTQWGRYRNILEKYNLQNPDKAVSAGLRVNPQCSVIETDLYNPALPGSRFGVTSDMLAELPEGIEGLHFHQLCESTSYDLEQVLNAFEEQFGHLLEKVKWVNMGGGHLMTKEGYDCEHLIGLIKAFRERHNGIRVILEPGSAFTWRTGDLIVSVVDTVKNQGVNTAIIDASFACHMPDTLEMPYQPIVSESCEADTPGAEPWRLGGNSCLSGDYKGDWWFIDQLVAGQRLTLEDMNHYTTVKTTMFNGIQHPSIALVNSDGSWKYLRQYSYEDYKNRMS